MNFVTTSSLTRCLWVLEEIYIFLNLHASSGAKTELRARITSTAHLSHSITRLPPTPSLPRRPFCHSSPLHPLPLIVTPYSASPSPPNLSQTPRPFCCSLTPTQSPLRRRSCHSLTPSPPTPSLPRRPSRHSLAAHARTRSPAPVEHVTRTRRSESAHYEGYVRQVRFLPRMSRDA